MKKRKLQIIPLLCAILLLSLTMTAGVAAAEDDEGVAITRAAMAMSLWLEAGSPEPTIADPYTDLDPGAYYYKAVLWAVETSSMLGVSTETFDPDGRITKAQAATILHRAAGQPAVPGTLPIPSAT